MCDGFWSISAKERAARAAAARNLRVALLPNATALFRKP
jgi:hypothetical protein